MRTFFGITKRGGHPISPDEELMILTSSRQTERKQLRRIAKALEGWAIVLPCPIQHAQWSKDKGVKKDLETFLTAKTGSDKTVNPCRFRNPLE